LNTVTDQSQRWKSGLRGHLAHLSISPFRQDKADPGGWDLCAIADRRMSFRYRGIGVDQAGFGRAGGIRFIIDRDGDPGFQAVERGGADGSFYLNPIFPLVGERRVQQPVVQPPVICQDQQSFTVEIQPADRIDIGRDGEEIFQCRLAFLRRELREDPEWFVYDVVMMHVLAICCGYVTVSLETKSPVKTPGFNIWMG
jgi:hypothetical protein